MTQQPKKRIEWLSAREISIIAAIGGLELATVLLGLVIPVGPGGWSVWALEGLTILPALATGPVGGFIAYVIPGIVRPVAVANIMVSGNMILIGAGYWPMRKWKTWKKILGVALISFPVWTLYQGYFTVWFMAYYYHFITVEAFWPTFWYLQFAFNIPEWIYGVVCAAITFTLFPRFIQPDWLDRWRGRI